MEGTTIDLTTTQANRLIHRHLPEDLMGKKIASVTAKMVEHRYLNRGIVFVTFIPQANIGDAVVSLTENEFNNAIKK